MRKTATALSDAARDALGAAQITSDGQGVRLANQLERSVYVEVAEALKRAGFVWNRHANAHVLNGDAAAALNTLGAMLDTGIAPAKNPLAFYPTPPAIAKQAVVALSCTERWCRAAWGDSPSLLEPSAGDGALLRAFVDENPRTASRTSAVAVEVDPDRYQALLLRYLEGAFHGFGALWRDFMDWWTPLRFDYVLMNPPFDNGAAQRHIYRAWQLLNPGGALVAIAPAGVTGRNHQLKGVIDLHGAIEDLPDGSFSQAGTDVRTVLLTLEKPT